MTDEEAKAAEQAAAAEKAKLATDESKKDDKEKATETVSKAEYDKLHADLENFKRIEEERKGKEKKRQEELLKEQGKFKDLYDAAAKEVEVLKAKVEKLDTVMQGMLDEELKGLPEEFDKTLIPTIEPYDKVVWLRKAKSAFVATSANGGRKGDGTPAARSTGDFGGMKSIYNNPTSPKH
jgi:hypothetical protein